MICARGSHAGGKRVKDTIADAEIGHRPYPVAVDFQPVRDAYSSLSEEYIALYDGDWLHEDEGSLIRRHLTGLPGAVLDVGCGPGYWTAHLHSLGVDVTGIDFVRFLWPAGLCGRWRPMQVLARCSRDAPATIGHITIRVMTAS